MKPVTHLMVIDLIPITRRSLQVFTYTNGWRPCGLGAQHHILDRWSCLWGLLASNRGSQRKSCSQRPGYYVIPRALWLTLRVRQHCHWRVNQDSVTHFIHHLTFACLLTLRKYPRFTSAALLDISMRETS